MRILAVLLATLALGACALSPQTITVTPTLSVATATFGAGHSVNVQVTDGRPDAAIGSRGGVYSRSSTIRSANDVAATLRERAEAGFAAQGYAVTGTEADGRVHVTLEQLSYVVPEGAVATSADITVALRAKTERAGRQLETVYRSTVNRRFPVAPTATQNEAWINEVVSETLQRLLDDAKVRALLTE